mmetsp:Transcript_9828/g.26803  ORF Transcript_9828/g.26803 Transcript_9828/m.26803 type:complete len:393 (-) Transcript_9828:721-1899(-)
MDVSDDMCKLWHRVCTCTSTCHARVEAMHSHPDHWPASLLLISCSICIAFLCAGLNELYGSHPTHWYLWAGLPAISGLMLPFLSFDATKIASWQQGRRNLWIILACYIALHSLSPHKEFRFILPMLPIICILCGRHVQSFLGPRRRLMLLAALANVIAVVFLGCYHQRAPIDVNRSITDAVGNSLRFAHVQATIEANRNTSRDMSTSTSASLSTYRVDYLMGCHSAPLLSHLHMQHARFITKTLDCSPSCRSNPSVNCESDRFHHDPTNFIHELYGIQESSCESEDGGDASARTCPALEAQHSLPDFLVIMSPQLEQAEQILSRLGYTQLGQFFHAISGVGIMQGEAIEDGDLMGGTDELLALQVPFTDHRVRFSAEFMILMVRSSFAQPHV